MVPEQILTEADRCVKCGFCLPHCPTYRVTRNEGESPRGRIALMQALASGQLASSAALHAHLNRCLGCYACERACPSAVPYGRLIDGARELRNRREGRLRRQLRKGLLGLLSRPGLLRGAIGPLGLIKRAARFGGARAQRLAGLLPELSPPVRWRPFYPATGTSRGRVALFTGCVSRITDQGVLLAAIQVLNRLGRDVVIPPAQGCCGALHQHAGEPAAAHRFVVRNRHAFSDQKLEAVLTVASGCGAWLIGAGALPAPAHDISAYLSALPWPRSLRLQPLVQRVALHDPCSLRNSLGDADAPRRLLCRIPEIELAPLPGNEFCCGAGGLNLLTEPQMADALLAPKLAALRRCPPDILVTSNSGCALHLAAGIRKAGLEIEVLHPVELLVRQMK